MALACKPMLSASKIEGGGSVINMASMSSFIAVPIVPGYGAAKAGIVQMTKNLAISWVNDGIRVNAIAPGLIESNMTAVMKGDSRHSRIPKSGVRRWDVGVHPTISRQRFSSSRAVAPASSPGQTLNVDGGYSVA